MFNLCKEHYKQEEIEEVGEQRDCFQSGVHLTVIYNICDTRHS